MLKDKRELVKIGEGEFSNVYLVSDADEQYVLKKYISGKGAEARREYLFLKSITSPYVVKPLGINMGDEAELKMEYIEGFPIDEDTFTPEIMKQCCVTLSDIHTKGIIVNDIKSKNILVKDGEAFFIDFGLATVTNYNDNRFRGTPAFSAPEKFKFNANTVASDIFSLGLLFLSLTENLSPSAGKSNAAFKRLLLDETAWKTFQKRISSDIIRKMVNFKPLDRPSLNDIILTLDSNHQFSHSEARGVVFPSQVAKAKQLIQNHKITLNRFDEPDEIATLFKLLSENEDRTTVILDEDLYITDSARFFKNLGVGLLDDLSSYIKINDDICFILLRSDIIATHNYFNSLVSFSNCYTIQVSLEKPSLNISLSELEECFGFLKFPQAKLEQLAGNAPTIIKDILFADKLSTDNEELLALLNLNRVGIPIVLIEKVFADWEIQLSSVMGHGLVTLNGGYVSLKNRNSLIVSEKLLERVKVEALNLKLYYYVSLVLFLNNNSDEGISYFTQYLAQLIKKEQYQTALESSERMSLAYPILKEDFSFEKRYAFLLRKNSFLHDSLEVYDSLLDSNSGLKKAILLSDRAVVESELKHLDSALHNLQESATIFKSLEQVKRYARTLNNIGYTQFQMDNLSGALRTFREVHKYAGVNKLPNWEAVSLLNLADTFLQQGNWAKSIHFGNQAYTKSVELDKFAYSLQAELIVCQARVICGEKLNYEQFILEKLSEESITQNNQLLVLTIPALIYIYFLANINSAMIIKRVESYISLLGDVDDKEYNEALFWLNYIQGNYLKAVEIARLTTSGVILQNLLENSSEPIKYFLDQLVSEDRLFRLGRIVALISKCNNLVDSKAWLQEFMNLANINPLVINKTTETEGDLGLVWQIIQAIVTGENSKEVINATLLSLLKIGNMERAIFYKLEGDKLNINQAFDLSGVVDSKTLSISHSVLEEVVKNRKLTFFSDLMDEVNAPVTASIFGLGLRSAVGFPLIISGKVEGVFYSDALSKESFSSAHQMYLEVISIQSNSVLERLILLDQLKNAKKGTQRIEGFHGIIGSSKVMVEIFEKIKVIGKHNINVLIGGETGTGKELIAKAIHNEYAKSEPFVPINCAAIPENLLESELFGHAKGAFTGADSDKIGLFEAAGSGTIFLDEIGEMPLLLQAKVLRVLQERVVTPLGATTAVKVRMRVIAASNRNLNELIKQNLFRSDLLYRLSVYNITLPSLSQRREDIPLLVQYFIEKFNTKFNKKIKGTDLALMQKIQNREWAGNIRELENFVEQSVVVSNSEILDSALLVEEVQPQDTLGSFPINWQEYKQFRKEYLKDLDVKYLKTLLNLVDDNYSAAARLAGVSRIQIYRLQADVTK